MLAILLRLIGCYRRWISPLKPPCCRFVPTCSTYAQEALAQHGLLRGLALSSRRLCRCHPWGGDGYDPVPAPPVAGAASAARIRADRPVR